MKKRWIALLLALAMLLGALTGCGDKAADDGDDENNPAAGDGTEPAENDGETGLTEVPAEAREDPVAYVTDGAIHGDDVVMTVNGIDVPAGAFTYWLSDQYGSDAYLYQSYGVALDVTEVGEDGTTVADHYVQQAEQICQMNAVLQSKALEAGLELTEEQKEGLTQLEESFDQDSLTYYATNAEALTAAYEASCLASNLQDSLYGEGGAEAPTAETLADYAEETGTYTCRYILLYTADLEEGDDESRAAQLAQAQALYDQLAACAPEELEETFSQLQAEYNYDGNTDPFTFNDESSLAEGFRETVSAVDVGELAISDETMYGYFVILRLDNDLDALREDYASGAFEGKIDQWMEEADVTVSDALEELDAVGTLQRLQALQDALIAELTAAYADTETAE